MSAPRSTSPDASAVTPGLPAMLAGVRIIDMTAVLMGPYATQLLGEMGADVIKVEPPSGDTSRGIGAMRNPGMGAGFLQVNRHKRSIAIDIKKPEGRELFLELIRDADVCIYNVRPAAMARLRLTYDDLRAVNPKIIQVGVFGYGQDGPYAAQPAYDDLIQGAIGLPSLVAQVGDGVPRYVPIVFIDRAVGLAAVNAVTAALFHRERTGQGQAIEVPMFETMVPFVMGEHMGGQTFDPPEGDFGYQRLLASHRRPYRTHDGHVCAVIYTDRHWRSFYELSGRAAEFDADPRLETIGERTRHMNQLCEELAVEFARRDTAHWVEALKRIDIPCMPLHTFSSLRQDPHLEAIGYFEHHEHPSEGALWQMRPAASSSLPAADAARLAPRLGQHTEELLRELGKDAAQIRSLCEAGIVRADTRPSHATAPPQAPLSPPLE